MIDWAETPVPKDLPQLWDRLNRLVRSLPDWTFVGWQFTGAEDGELVAHGGRSVPRRVLFEVVDSVTPTPVILVGEKTATHVRLFASAEMGANLVFLF